MLQKGARFALALVLSLALCPAAAFAEGEEYWGEGGYAATQATEVPVITTVDPGSSTVTVNGVNFGATQGTGTASLATGGVAGGDVIASSVSTWSDDEIVLDVDDDLGGIIDVEVTTDAGTASMSHYISAGPDVYEFNDFAKPEDEFASTYTGPLASSGILKGWGEYLYYLRETPMSSDGTEFGFHTFERYGVESGEWETLESLPEWLTYASGCIWNDNFLVAGVNEEGAEAIYFYNFALGGSWEPLDAEGVPLGAGIVNLNGYLKIVGGADSEWNLVNTVYDYDTPGLGDLYATLETPVFCPQLAVNQGQIFVYSYGDTLAAYNGEGARHLQVVVDDETVELSGVFPEFAGTDVPEAMPNRAEAFGSIAPAIEGLMLVGPASADGATDTYILDWDWESASFLPFYKRASDARLYGAAACIHNNLLYAAAASEIEPEHSVFRATEVIAPAVESGNYQVWRQGSSDMLTITYTPDYSRFYDTVLVDGVELYSNDEYIVSSGSTVVDFVPAYLSTLAAGEHEVITYFDGYQDGPGAEVHAFFTIENQSTPIINPGGDNAGGNAAKGYTRPAALAMTGDLMLIVPFVILGAGAVALGIYLVRRRIRNN